MMHHPMESIIGSALLGIDDNGESVSREVSEARMDCNIYASDRIMCGCGQIHDQETICIFERLDGDNWQPFMIGCDNCTTQKIIDKIAITASANDIKVRLTTWSGYQSL